MSEKIENFPADEMEKIEEEARQENERYNKNEQGYGVVDTKQMLVNGKKWATGAYEEKDSVFHSEQIEIGTIKMSEAVSKERHVHKYMDEVFKIEKGWLDIRVGDRNIKLVPGKVLVVKPGTPHEIIDYEAGTVIFLVRTPSVKGDKEVVE